MPSTEFIERSYCAADITGVMTKLGKIQEELFVPKDQKNDFGHYSYRSCEDILHKLKPLLKKHKCVMNMETGLFQIGERYYVKAKIGLYDLESGMAISSCGWAREDETKKGMDGCQITGAAISYARKYALAGMFGIDNEKDSDATNNEKDSDATNNEKDSDATNKGDVEEKPKKAVQKKDAGFDKISDTQIMAIQAELDRTGVSESVILDAVKKHKLSDMTHADYLNVIARLNNTSDKE